MNYAFLPHGDRIKCCFNVDAYWKGLLQWIHMWGFLGLNLCSLWWDLRFCTEHFPQKIRDHGTRSRNRLSKVYKSTTLRPNYVIFQKWSIFERLLAVTANVGGFRSKIVFFLVWFEFVVGTRRTKNFQTTFAYFLWICVVFECTWVCTFKVTMFTLENLCLFICPNTLCSFLLFVHWLKLRIRVRMIFLDMILNITFNLNLHKVYCLEVLLALGRFLNKFLFLDIWFL